MVNSTRKRTGRPLAVYHPTYPSDPIPGLMRLKDGRWRASGPEKWTFSEPDERLAVSRFRQWKEGKQQSSNLGTVRIHKSAMELFADMRRRTLAAGGSLDATITESEDGSGTRALSDHTLNEKHWAWLRKQILNRPQWVAEMVGIEQIGYLAHLPKPMPSPTLDDVGRLYLDHAKISDNWRAKCKLFWQEFHDAVAVGRLRELTQEHVVDYGDMIHEAAQTPTYARQRFGAIKAIINYPTKRGKWAEDAKRALALCSVLVPPKKSAADPCPISPEDFHTLYRNADAPMQAMLLLALNGCMYGGEVTALNWSDIDLKRGVLNTERSKTRIVRVAVLWPQTIAALKQLPRTTEAVFLTNGTKAQHNYQTAYKAFKALRKTARVGGVQFSHIRDGGYTAAVEAGTELNICRLLAGHATGISDHYVKRRPTMVAAACDAIRKAYRIDVIKR